MRKLLVTLLLAAFTASTVPAFAATPKPAPAAAHKSKSAKAATSKTTPSKVAKAKAPGGGPLVCLLTFPLTVLNPPALKANCG